MKSFFIALTLLSFNSFATEFDEAKFESDFALKMLDLHRPHYNLERQEIDQVGSIFLNKKIDKTKLVALLANSPWASEEDRQYLSTILAESDFAEVTITKVSDDIIVRDGSKKIRIKAINAFEGIFEVDGKVVNVNESKTLRDFLSHFRKNEVHKEQSFINFFISNAYALTSSSLSGGVIASGIVTGVLSKGINDKYADGKCELYRDRAFSPMREELFQMKDECNEKRFQEVRTDNKFETYEKIKKMKESIFKFVDGEKIIDNKKWGIDSPLCLQMIKQYPCFDHSDRIYYCQALDNLRSCLMTVEDEIYRVDQSDRKAGKKLESGEGQTLDDSNSTSK